MLGIPRYEDLRAETFEAALLRKEVHKVEMRSLIVNKQRQMTRVKFNKVGLSDISLKLFVSDDAITCTPFKKNNKYI